MQIDEIEHLMEMDGAGLTRYSEAQGMGERIRDWLDTPNNTIADKPGWGHNLATLRHEPIGPHLEVMAEMLIIEKMRRDIRDLSVTGVAVEFLEVDLCRIDIDFTFGSFSEVLTL